MWISQAHYDLIIERMRLAEQTASDLATTLAAERSENRNYTQTLIDRILVRHNSRPITPPEPMVAPEPAMTPLDVARMRDRLQEELEHRGVMPGDVTPDVRLQLEDMLEDMIQDRI